MLQYVKTEEVNGVEIFILNFFDGKPTHQNLLG